MAVGDRLQIADKPTLDLTKADITEILERIGDTGEAGDSVIEMLQTLLNTPKIIKHIQRGVSTFTQTNINIQLSGFTNAEKMIAIIDGGWDSRGVVCFPYISSLTESNLAVSSNATNVNYHVSYQVIEFA